MKRPTDVPNSAAIAKVKHYTEVKGVNTQRNHSKFFNINPVKRPTDVPNSAAIAKVKHYTEAKGVKEVC